MSKARLVITAVTLENRPVAEVAADYNVARSWIYELLARYKAEGEAAFEPRSRRPHTSPGATDAATVELIVRLRKELTEAGLDAGAETIGWHLTHHHKITVSRATIHRILLRNTAVTPDPSKRPKSSYLRFEAEQPNETWQSDFTHYRLAGGQDVEVITWLDDYSRMALHVSAHRRITAPIVADTFTETAAQHGYPASTLTDNGMVYTVRFASHRGGKTKLELELRRLGIAQKNSRPNHPTTCGKVERFQQTMKKWLRAQPDQPSTIAELQALLDRFRDHYNQHRPHRSLATPSNPATAYSTRPKATPGADPKCRDPRPGPDTTASANPAADPAPRHRLPPHRHRTNLRRNLRPAPDPGPQHHASSTPPPARLLRELVLDPTRDYQRTGRPPDRTETNSGPAKS